MSKKRVKNYFNEVHEQAVIDYKYEQDFTIRDKIFEEILCPVLERMIESILNRYKLYDKRKTYDNIIKDCLSFLHEKIYYFDEKRRTCRICKVTTIHERCELCDRKTRSVKAYSFLGTIVRRYLIGERNKTDREKLCIEPTDSIYEEANNINTVIVQDEGLLDDKDGFFKFVITYLKKNEENICENDIISNDIFKSIILFLENPSSVPIYSKKALYILIKELTGVEDTIILTAFFKKLKVHYEKAKYLYYNSEEN